MSENFTIEFAAASTIPVMDYKYMILIIFIDVAQALLILLLSAVPLHGFRNKENI